MSNIPRSNNRRSVADYEHSVREYIDTVDGRLSASVEALRLLAAGLAPGGCVLEIGSGPGWDADFLETLGVDVHRTDAAAAFCRFQTERGKRCARLDLLSDRIDGYYGGAMMLCVLQHFERAELDTVLRNLAQVLAVRGVLLLMYPEGDDEHWEQGVSGDYRVVHWSPAAFDARLTQAGFAITWEEVREGRGGSWRTVLARKQEN